MQFDEKPVGRHSGALAVKMMSSSSNSGGDDEFASLPLSQLLVHRNWKARVSGYARVSREPARHAAVLLEVLEVVAARESNAAALEALLEVLQAVLQQCRTESTAADEQALCRHALPLLLERGLVGRPRAALLSQQLATALVERGHQSDVLEATLAALSHRAPRTRLAATQLCTQLVRDFGVVQLPLASLVRAVQPLFADSNAQVRHAALELCGACYCYVGTSLFAQLTQLRDVQAQELQAHCATLATGAVPQRHVRGAAGATAATTTTPTTTAAAAAAQPSQRDDDDDEAFARLPESVVVGKLPSNFIVHALDKQASWQDRCALVSDHLLPLLAAPRLRARDNYHELAVLMREYVQDPQAPLMLLGYKMTQEAARGLRGDFAPHARALLPLLFDKMKDKKASVHEHVMRTLEALLRYHCVSLEQCLDEVDAASTSRNPTQRLALVRFCGRAVRVLDGGGGAVASSKVAALRLAHATTYLRRALSDEKATVREAAFVLLRRLLADAGEDALRGVLDTLDERQMIRLRNTPLVEDTAAPAVVRASATANGAASTLRHDGGSGASTPMPTPTNTSSLACSPAKKMTRLDDGGRGVVGPHTAQHGSATTSSAAAQNGGAAVGNGDDSAVTTAASGRVLRHKSSRVRVTAAVTSNSSINNNSSVAGDASRGAMQSCVSAPSAATMTASTAAASRSSNHAVASLSSSTALAAATATHAMHGALDDAVTLEATLPSKLEALSTMLGLLNGDTTVLDGVRAGEWDRRLAAVQKMRAVTSTWLPRQCAKYLGIVVVYLDAHPGWRESTCQVLHAMLTLLLDLVTRATMVPPGAACAIVIGCTPRLTESKNRQCVRDVCAALAQRCGVRFVARHMTDTAAHTHTPRLLQECNEALTQLLMSSQQQPQQQEQQQQQHETTLDGHAAVATAASSSWCSLEASDVRGLVEYLRNTSLEHLSPQVRQSAVQLLVAMRCCCACDSNNNSSATAASVDAHVATMSASIQSAYAQALQQLPSSPPLLFDVSSNNNTATAPSPSAAAAAARQRSVTSDGGDGAVATMTLHGRRAASRSPGVHARVRTSAAEAAAAAAAAATAAAAVTTPMAHDKMASAVAAAAPTATLQQPTTTTTTTAAAARACSEGVSPRASSSSSMAQTSNDGGAAAAASSVLLKQLVRDMTCGSDWRERLTAVQRVEVYVASCCGSGSATGNNNNGNESAMMAGGGGGLSAHAVQVLLQALGSRLEEASKNVVVEVLRVLALVVEAAMASSSKQQQPQPQQVQQLTATAATLPPSAGGGDAVAESCRTALRRLLPSIFAMLGDQKQALRDEARRVALLSVRVIGLDGVLPCVQQPLSGESSMCRQHTLEVLVAGFQARHGDAALSRAVVYLLIPPVVRALMDRTLEVRLAAEQVVGFFVAAVGSEALLRYAQQLKEAERQVVVPAIERQVQLCAGTGLPPTAPLVTAATTTAAATTMTSAQRKEVEVTSPQKQQQRARSRRGSTPLRAARSSSVPAGGAHAASVAHTTTTRTAAAANASVLLASAQSRHSKEGDDDGGGGGNNNGDDDSKDGGGGGGVRAVHVGGSGLARPPTQSLRVAQQQPTTTAAPPVATSQTLALPLPRAPSAPAAATTTPPPLATTGDALDTRNTNTTVTTTAAAAVVYSIEAILADLLTAPAAVARAMCADFMRHLHAGDDCSTPELMQVMAERLHDNTRLLDTDLALGLIGCLGAMLTSPRGAARCHSSLLFRLFGVLFDCLLSEQFSLSDTVIRALNNMTLRLLESAPANEVFSALLSRMTSYSAAYVRSSSRADLKYIQVTVKCIMRVRLDAVVRDNIIVCTHEYLLQHPPSAFRQLDDLPIRTVKTLLQNATRRDGAELLASAERLVGSHNLVTHFIRACLDADDGNPGVGNNSNNSSSSSNSNSSGQHRPAALTSSSLAAAGALTPMAHVRTSVRTHREHEQQAAEESKQQQRASQSPLPSRGRRVSMHLVTGNVDNNNNNTTPTMPGGAAAAAASISTATFLTNNSNNSNTDHANSNTAHNNNNNNKSSNVLNSVALAPRSLRTAHVHVDPIVVHASTASSYNNTVAAGGGGGVTTTTPLKMPTIRSHTAAPVALRRSSATHLASPCATTTTAALTAAVGKDDVSASQSPPLPRSSGGAVEAVQSMSTIFGHIRNHVTSMQGIDELYAHLCRAKDEDKDDEFNHQLNRCSEAFRLYIKRKLEHKAAEDKDRPAHFVLPRKLRELT